MTLRTKGVQTTLTVIYRRQRRETSATYSGQRHYNHCEGVVHMDSPGTAIFIVNYRNNALIDVLAYRPSTSTCSIYTEDTHAQVEG